MKPIVEMLGTVARFAANAAVILTMLFALLVAYQTLAWSWDLMLWAALAVLAGLMLTGTAGALASYREAHAAHPGVTRLGTLTCAMGEHAARGFATSGFAMAAGLICAAMLQAWVLSFNSQIFSSDIRYVEDGVIYMKLWIDRVLGLDVLAALLVTLIAISFVMPVSDLYRRTLSLRSTLSFVHVVLMVLASFTFFSGLALKPAELVQRDYYQHKAAGDLEFNRFDTRKQLVAIAWLCSQLEESPPSDGDGLHTMRDYLKNAPYDGELTAAAWRIAGFDGARYFLEDDTRRQQRYRNETVILATTYEPDLSSWREALQPLTRFYRTLLDGTFASLKAGTEPQAWHFLQLDRALQVQREPDSLETPYRVSRRAAQTVLTDLLANAIAGGVTNDALGSLFVGDLVQAVATPLWDVVLPLDIVDLASARSFIARQTLQRTPLQWARLDHMPERSPQLTTSAPAVSGSEMPSSGIGAVTSLSIPLPPTPSWQAMDSATVFVTLPVSGSPSVYVRPAIGFH